MDRTTYLESGGFVIAIDWKWVYDYKKELYDRYNELYREWNEKNTLHWAAGNFIGKEDLPLTAEIKLIENITCYKELRPVQVRFISQGMPPSIIVDMYTWRQIEDHLKKECESKQVNFKEVIQFFEEDL